MKSLDLILEKVVVGEEKKEVEMDPLDFTDSPIDKQVRVDIKELLIR